ncbi:MAG: hypothetical protein KGH94_04470 [Candidatus Micrarchaeota archaeon]|nr:hypothetical protein [Candidatus Micrarchaeota archaeon]
MDPKFCPLMVLAASMLCGLAFGAGHANNASAAGAMVSKISCQSALAQDYLSNLSSTIPGISGNLTEYSQELAYLDSQLSASSGISSVIAVELMMSRVSNPLFASIGSGIRLRLSQYAAAYEAGSGAGSSQTLARAAGGLTASYVRLLGAYYNCTITPDRTVAGYKINAYQSDIAGAASYTRNLSYYGVNVSGLDQVINGANASVMAPLQSMVAAANSTTQLEVAIGHYCLYNGCTQQIYYGNVIQKPLNYHFDARMRIGSYQLVLSRLENTKAASNASDLYLAQSHISIASEILQAAGTGSLSQAQGRALAQNLTDAAALMRAATGQPRLG